MNSKHESYPNETTNFTKPPSQINGNDQFETNNMEVAMLFSVAAAIVIINSLVFYLFLKKKTLRTISNYPLFSLAVCDFFCGFVIIPLFAILYFTPLIQPNGSIRFYLGFIVTVLHNFVAIATVYHIVVVTGERYLAIKFPFKHLVLDKKSIITVLAVVWLSSLLVSCLPFTWISKIYPVYRPESSRFELCFAVFCMVFALVLPYIFLVYAFIDMFKGVNGRSRGGSRQRNSTVRRRLGSFESQSVCKGKCLVLFAIMASVYLICWLPWFVMFLLHQLSIDSSKLIVPSQVALIIRYMTSVVNPLLYTFMKRDFFQAFMFEFSRRRPVTVHTDCNHASALSFSDLRGPQTSKEGVGSIGERTQEHIFETAC